MNVAIPPLTSFDELEYATSNHMKHTLIREEKNTEQKKWK